MPIQNHYYTRLICSKVKISCKQKHSNYIIDTNEMNLQNILNQCSLNQMIIIHMIKNAIFSFLSVLFLLLSSTITVVIIISIAIVFIVFIILCL